MRRPLYDTSARRRTVSVTLNSDLVAKAQARGINISKVAEAALATAFETAERAAIIAEMEEAARFTEEYVRQHGLPFQEARAWGRLDEEDGLRNPDAA